MGFITDNSDCNDNLITYVDNDLDGFGVGSPVACGTATVTNDCDDNEPAVYPGAPEVCNGVDDDCNGLTDDGLTFLDYYVDFDGDGFGDQFATPVSSCNPVFDSVTNDLDCNDNNAAVNPNAVEICDAVDQNCNAILDENNSLHFDGTNDYVQMNDFNLGASDFTLEAWIFRTGSNNGYILSNRTVEDNAPAIGSTLPPAAT
ncbi:MAG: hypothetical protein IPM91_20400 [Bacteroidetes bacterium]|nr:hypothetical protein [Bacteroidota bacterium]